MQTDFTLLRNAKVEVTPVINEKKHVEAKIVVNDAYVHQFDQKSRVSKHLELMTPRELSDRLTNGTFMFVDSQLVDFRDGDYNGFIHTDESLNKFMEVLGCEQKSNLVRQTPHRVKRNQETFSPIALRKAWSESDITVPGYSNDGGNFKTQLAFEWNPFVRTINSTFDLVRLICENGMVGLTSFLNTRVPVVNRWEEHLDIASRQIQNKINTTVVDRVKLLSNIRATVADCLLLSDHIGSRTASGNTTDQTEINKLFNLMMVVNPRQHLGDVYRDSVFSDRNLAAQLPSHLTGFDAFNIATELRTHTAQVAKSSDNALDKFANGLLFDRTVDPQSSASRFTTPKVSAFSDPNRAFYGIM